MFKTANDIRSNLILNALSWVDHYRPRYVYFENVTGFLSFHLNAKQAGIHRLEGGVTMGGLKLLIRSLLEMGHVSKPNVEIDCLHIVTVQLSSPI